MSFYKIRWIIRAIAYSCCGEIKFPSYIGKPIYISKLSKLKFNKKVRIYPGMRLETIGENSALIIGENTSIGQNFHAVSYEEPLIIGNNVTISGNVFITNCSHGYYELDKSVLEQDIIKKKTTIEDNCFIGYGAVIQAGTHLGKQCIVGANAVVKGDFPDYSVIAGVPARIIKRYNHNTKKWEKI